MAPEDHYLDFSRPLAPLIREATKEVHDSVQTNPGAQRLLSGQLPKDRYIQYLMMLWHVYDTLERALEQHSAHPTLEPTFSPALLIRSPSLVADISYLLQVPTTSWKSHPLCISLISTPPPALTAYTQRITYLANSADPSPLLAHSYIRYLGNLSGGQIIRRLITKAYGLDEESGLGAQYYAYKELNGTGKKAGLGEMNRIKDWFKDGMNKATDGNEALKAAIVDEAFLTYELNIRLSAALEALDTEDVSAHHKEETGPPLKVSVTEPRATYMAALIAATACLVPFIVVMAGLVGNEAYQRIFTFNQSI